MKPRLPMPRGGLAALLCALSLALCAPAARSAVSVALVPSSATVLPTAEFDVFVDLTSAGSAFNGFSLVLTYDPAALTLLPTVPTSLQEGCLMTGGCSAACGNTFHQFLSAADSISINDYLFCNQVSLTGPGRLYKLHFRAGGTAQTATLGIRRAVFYDAGVLVTPVSATGTQVVIPFNVGVGDTPLAPRALSVQPNPAFGRAQLVLDDAQEGLVEAAILDLQGRVVRHLGPAWLGTRARLDWDGATDAGSPAAGGLYLARVQRNGAVQTSRFVLVR